MVSILFIKLIVSVALVLSLSAVAEHVSPKAAGLLAGYPAGAAITLFFIGLDISPEFAADSAAYTMMGLVATQVFVYCYFKNFPMGLGSLITYTLCVSIVFPTSGIYIGTVISLAAASIYLLVYRLVAVRIR